MPNFSILIVDGKKVYRDQETKTDHNVWTKEQCLEKHRAARKLDPYLEHALARIDKYAAAQAEKGKMQEMLAKDNAAIFKKSAEWILQNESPPEIDWQSLDDETLYSYYKSPDQGIQMAAVYESDRREAEQAAKQEDQAQALETVFEEAPQETPPPAKKSLFGKPKPKGLFSK